MLLAPTEWGQEAAAHLRGEGQPTAESHLAGSVNGVTVDKLGPKPLCEGLKDRKQKGDFQLDVEGILKP